MLTMLLDINVWANTVVFSCNKNPRVMEPGAKAGRWNLTQDAKAWLVAEGVKVFINIGDDNQGQVATLKFKKEDSARRFFNRWK